MVKVFVSLFGFQVLRVKLVYDKDPSRDKSPPGNGGKWKRDFYDNGFWPRHAEEWSSANKSSFHEKRIYDQQCWDFFFLFHVAFIMIHFSTKAVYALFSFVGFIDGNPKLQAERWLHPLMPLEFYVSQHLKRKNTRNDLFAFSEIALIKSSWLKSLLHRSLREAN